MNQMSCNVKHYTLTFDSHSAQNAGCMVKTSKQSDTSQKGIRMDRSLAERIDKYRAKVRQKTGIEMSFSAALRALIEQGLKGAQ